MFSRRLLMTTGALLGALAIAAPVAGAQGVPAAGAAAAPPSDVCLDVAAAGPMAVLGPYGVLGDYGPLGAHAGQPNPAAGCGSATGFALPGYTVGSFVTGILGMNGQVPGPVK